MFGKLLGSLFGIKPNEWDGVLYFFLVLAIFSLGSSFARSIGMTLVIDNLGKESLPFMFIFVDLCVMIGSLIYAHYTKKSTGLNILGFFFLITSLFTVVAQGLFFFNERWQQLDWIYGFFFVGFSFFNVLIYIHIGSVIASYFTAVQIKRLSAIINAGLPIGGVIGGSTLFALIDVFHFQPQRLVFVLAAACLGAFSLLFLIRSRLSPVRAGTTETKGKRSPLRELLTAFRYVTTSHLMIFMSLGLMMFVIANKLLEYQYQGVIYPSIFTDTSERTAFFATYEIFANLAWLLIQLLVTSRLVVSLGVGGSNVLYPVLTTLASFALFGFFYWHGVDQVSDTVILMLGLGIFTQFINQEMRLALRTPANNLLFNAVPPNLWGTNKAFLNGIIFPFSTFIASITLIMMVGESSFIPGLSWLLDFEHDFTEEELYWLFPAIALTVSLLGILAALPQWAAYNAGVFGLLNRELFDRRTNNELTNANSKSNTLKQVIEEKLTSKDPYHVVAALEMIRVMRLGIFGIQVGNLMLKTKNFDIKSHCITTLASLPQSNTNITYLVEALRKEQDAEALPLILKSLSNFKSVNLNQYIENLLKHPSPAVFVEACLSLYRHPLYPRKKDIEHKILARLKHQELPQFHLYLYALGELKQSKYSEIALPFLESRKQDIRLAAFTAYIYMLEGNLEPHKSLLLRGLTSSSKEIKLTAIRALKECQPLEDWTPIIRLLGAKDRTLVNESKELLRLNLSICKPTLIEYIFSPYSLAQEKFEILSLIYRHLTEAQQQNLIDMADASFQQFIRMNALIKVHHTMPERSKTSSLIGKILQEIAETHLLHVLTVITYASSQNFEFFQRVNRGLLSSSRANQGNALEVLSNAGEKYLTGRIVRYFDEKLLDLHAIRRIYESLFKEKLQLDRHNYEKTLLTLEHDMLRACLHYVAFERSGNFRLKNARRNVRILLLGEEHVKALEARRRVRKSVLPKPKQ